MPGEAAVEHREIGGDEVGEAQVVAEDFGEEQLSLAEHRDFQHVIELGVENVAGHGEVDVAQAEPLAGEVFGEGGGFRMIEQALDLRAERRGLREFALFGEREQFFVRHGAPEEIGEAAGEREVVEPAGRLAQEEEIGREQNGPEGRADGLLEGALLGELRGEERDEWLHVRIGDAAAKGAARELSQDAIGVGEGLGGDDFDAVAEVVDRGGALLHFAEETAVAFRRPRFVQRAFDVDPVDGEAGAVPGVGAGFVDGLRRGEAIGQNRDGGARFHVIHELDDLGRARWRIEVADEMSARAAHAAGARPHAEDDGLVGTLDARRGNAEPIAPAFAGIKLRRPQRLPCGGRERDHAAGVIGAENFFGRRANLMRVGQEVTRRRGLGLRAIGDGLVQRGVRRFEIAVEQEGGRVQRLANVVEAVGRGVEREQGFQRRRDAEQVAHGVFVFGAVQATEDDAAFGTAPGRGFGEARVEASQEGLRLRGVGARLVLGRHLAGAHAFENLPPARAGRGLGKSASSLSSRKSLFAFFSP